MCYTAIIHKISELWKIINDFVDCASTCSVPVLVRCLNDRSNYPHMFHSENRAKDILVFYKE